MSSSKFFTTRSERQPKNEENIFLTQPSTPQSTLSVRKCPTTFQPKLLTPVKPSTPFLLSSRLKHLLVPRTSRAHSWPDLTPECAQGLEWDTVLDYRTPDTRQRWENVSPLRGSPAIRLFSWGSCYSAVTQWWMMSSHSKIWKIILLMNSLSRSMTSYHLLFEIISSFWLDPRAQSSTYLGHVTGPGAKIGLAHLKNWKQNLEKLERGKVADY